MGSFASVEDYEARYGSDDDGGRLPTLLEDASVMIASQPGFARDEGDEAQTANLVRVTCAVVMRSLSAAGLAGIEDYSQGAIGFTASVKPYNPSGDMYLTRGELKALGLTGGRVGSTDPFGCAP